MKTLQDDVREKFAELIYGQISLAVFGEWIYANNEVKKIVGEDNYFILLHFSYWEEAKAHELGVLLKKMLSDEERIKLLLEAERRGLESVRNVCYELAELHRMGGYWEKFIPAEFHLYEIEFSIGDDGENPVDAIREQRLEEKAKDISRHFLRELLSKEPLDSTDESVVR